MTAKPVTVDSIDRRPPQPATARAQRPLYGDVRVPGDKSISHRALMLGALAIGETVVAGLLEGEDVLRTAAALRAMGASIIRDGDGIWRLHGVGIGGLGAPPDVLDMGNAGTGVRLLMGIVGAHPITATFTGDASLRRRPMARVATPLALMGAETWGRSGGRLPLTVRGARELLPIRYILPVASAQVKSAVLLAGLNAPGATTVIETIPTRDHTEVMLRHFGAEVRTADGPDGLEVTVTGQPELTGRLLTVPADPSSAAFPAVAALLVPDSEIMLRAVGTNSHRTGLYSTLAAMGADLSWENPRREAGEPVADLRVRAGPLRAVSVPASCVASMIDEVPILAVAAALAEGTTVVRGLAELRVKESDRLAAMVDGLKACGVAAGAIGDDLLVEGNGGAKIAGGATVATHLDHRIAMSFLILSLAAQAPITIDDMAPVATSFPNFAGLMAALGVAITGGETGYGLEELHPHHS